MIMMCTVFNVQIMRSKEKTMLRRKEIIDVGHPSKESVTPKVNISDPKFDNIISPLPCMVVVLRCIP